jgi:poly(A) polymerase
VGGGVRDLLLGREPKDFDVATDASPEEVRGLFRNCRLIGRRFRLAHVYFGREIIEVATFRAQVDAGEGEDGHDHRVDQGGRIVRDNVYGDIEEDAWRRDFTINALYYDIADFSVLDYVGGMEDLLRGVVRLIGDPEERYREDPVRMLRAIRFMAKLGLRIHARTEAPLYRLGHLLEDVPPARLFEEALKLFMAGQAVPSFEMLRHYRLFGRLFPATEASLSVEEHGFPRSLVLRALENTDQRVNAGKPVTPAFLFAALLWQPLQDLLDEGEGDALEPEEWDDAAERVLAVQRQRTPLPRRFIGPLKEIWSLQERLERFGQRNRGIRLLGHPRFRAAYDFLLLRNQAGEDLAEACAWWTELQETEQLPVQDSGRPRRRAGRRRASPPDTPPAGD